MAKPLSIRQTRICIALLFVVGLALILAAWGFQLFGGLNPCPLCLQQRWGYYLALPLLILAFGLAGYSRIWRFPLGMAALAFFYSTVVAAYHAGIERGLWKGPETCAVDSNLARMSDDPAALFDQLVARNEIVRCDEVLWSFLDHSMAGWNYIFTLLLGGTALVVALLPRCNGSGEKSLEVSEFQA